MNLRNVLIVLLIFVLLFGWHGHASYFPLYASGPVGLLLLVLIVCILAGVL